MLRYGDFVCEKGELVDEVTAVYMPHGKSYTGLDQIEIFCHGGRLIVKKIQDELINSGARMAEPGEFTRLAFMNGRIDLTQAEAVAEIISAKTDRAVRSAVNQLTGAYTEHVGMLRNTVVEILAEIESDIDFPEEEITEKEKDRILNGLNEIIARIKNLVDTYTGGKILKDGFRIAIAGKPNAGKSSLFNLLLKQERALVTPTAGTTRDYLSEWIDLEGYPVNIIDTAGLRQTGSSLELKGQGKSKEIIDASDLVIWIVDISGDNWLKEFEKNIKILNNTTKLVVGNKVDLVDNSSWEMENIDVYISCLDNTGIDNLKKRIIAEIETRTGDNVDGIAVTSSRHVQKLNSALVDLKKAVELYENSETPEIIAFQLKEAVNSIDEITGKVYTDEVLEVIFSRFCIGK